MEFHRLNISIIFVWGQYLKIREKKNFIGTTPEKSVIVLQKTCLYKDSNVSFTQDLAIQLLGKQ